jgi:hypothetical protein
MTWGFVAVAGASVITGAMGAKSAKDAARAQGRGADRATDESARQYDETRNDLAPWRNIGGGALNNLARVSGIESGPSGGYFNEQLYLQQNPDVAANEWASKNATEHWEKFGRHEGRQNPIVGGTPGTAAGSPDMSPFTQSPDYQFRRSEGMRGIEGSFAAGGMGQSGNALQALAEFNSNLAGGEFGNWWNRQSALAGVGQAATDATASYGARHAENAGANAMYAGNARASGIVGQQNAINNGVNQLAGAYGYYSPQWGKGSGGGAAGSGVTTGQPAYGTQQYPQWGWK